MATTAAPTEDTTILRAIYPRIQIVPLLYRVEDDLLYQLKES